MTAKQIFSVLTVIVIVVVSVMIPSPALADNSSPWFGQGCNTSYTGPGGLHAGGYSPQDLTQDQRQWLFEVFGNEGLASVGYGGESCGNNNPPQQPDWFGQGCGTSYTGPGGLRAGGYPPQDLSRNQRQWLFEVFGNVGSASEGYGGESCPWQQTQSGGDSGGSDKPWFGQGCNTSYTGPGGITAGGYSPQSLTRKQRQWLFEVFGNAGYASEGYGGESCGQNNPPSQDQSGQNQSGGSSGSSGASGRPTTGGIDLGAYCQSRGYSGADIDPNQQTAYGWGCNSGGSLVGIDMSDACRWQYNGSLPDALYSDFNNPYSWYCSSSGVDPYYEAPQYQNQEPPQDQTQSDQSGQSGGSDGNFDGSSTGGDNGLAPDFSEPQVDAISAQLTPKEWAKWQKTYSTLQQYSSKIDVDGAMHLVYDAKDIPGCAMALADTVSQSAAANVLYVSPSLYTSCDEYIGQAEKKILEKIWVDPNIFQQFWHWLTGG